MDKKSLILPGLLALLLIAGESLKRNPAFIEAVYSQKIYPLIIRGLNRITGRLPFSIFEMLLGGLLLAIVVALGVLGWQIYRGRLARGWGIQAALRLLTVVLSFVLLFNVLWGFNYYRLSLADQLGIKLQQHRVQELEALCDTLIRQANTLSGTVERDGAGVMISPQGVGETVSRTAPGFVEAHRRTGLFSGTYGAPKPVLNSKILAYAGISGIYSPFTGEANVNALIPAAFLPATAMHEAAHAYGYAREDEANFIAWLACSLHPDSDYRYSGALLGLTYSMNALYGADQEAWQQLRQQYSPRVAADLAANREFWKRYEGPAEELQTKVNDRYLKANGQTDGVASYGRMVDLLLEVNGGKLSISE